LHGLYQLFSLLILSML